VKERVRFNEAFLVAQRCLQLKALQMSCRSEFRIRSRSLAKNGIRTRLFW